MIISLDFARNIILRSNIFVGITISWKYLKSSLAHSRLGYSKLFTTFICENVATSVRRQ